MKILAQFFHWLGDLFEKPRPKPIRESTFFQRELDYIQKMPPPLDTGSLSRSIKPLKYWPYKIPKVKKPLPLSKKNSAIAKGLGRTFRENLQKIELEAAVKPKPKKKRKRHA